MYKLIMWDLDGTIADTSRGVINAVKTAVEKMGLPNLYEEEYRRFIGPPNVESYHNYFGLEGAELQKAINIHKEYAVKKGAMEAVLYPGILELTKEIRKTKRIQTVTTLKLQESAEKVLKNLRIDDCFDYIIGASQKINEKSQLLEEAINLSGIDKKDSVLIGDSIYDQMGANALGIDFIAVTYGFGFNNKKETLNYPVKYCADSIEQLRNVLLD